MPYARRNDFLTPAGDLELYRRQGGESPEELKLEDFADADRLAQREHELESVRRPAGTMYTGKQHVYMMSGVDKLRRAYGNNFVVLRILSAGYRVRAPSALNQGSVGFLMKHAG